MGRAGENDLEQGDAMSYVVAWLSQSAAVQGAIGGWLVAARVDYEAFKHWQSFDEAKAYNWKVAAWRWLQGAIIGAVTLASGGAVFPPQ